MGSPWMLILSFFSEEGRTDMLRPLHRREGKLGEAKFHLSETLHFQFHLMTKMKRIERSFQEAKHIFPWGLCCDLGLEGIRSSPKVLPVPSRRDAQLCPLGGNIAQTSCRAGPRGNPILSLKIGCAMLCTVWVSGNLLNVLG